MQLKAIIFDYGGVLCFHPPEQEIQELADLCRVDRERFLAAYWSLRAEYDRARLEPREYWSATARILGQSYSEAEIAEFRRRDIGFWIHLDERMVAWARRVRAGGIRTAVLSNLPRDLGEHLRREMDFVGQFDHHSFSYELGSAKPDPAIYRHAVEGLGVEPGEALFIDDRAENVEGALAIGLRAIRFETPELLKEHLAVLPLLSPAQLTEI